MAVPFVPEQRFQATDISAFYRSNGLKKGDPFLVTVINVKRKYGIYSAG